MDTPNWTGKEIFGMQLKNDFGLDTARKIERFFKGKIEDIVIGKVTETDDEEIIFDITFRLYNYFIITAFRRLRE